MDSESAFQLDILDRRPATIQCDVLATFVENSSYDGRIEKGHHNYFCTFIDEIELMKQAEAVISDSHPIISSLYTYRSVSQSIPEISLSDYATEELTIAEKSELAAKTAEINQKLIEILQPEIGKMASVISFVLNIANLLNNFIIYGSKRKNGLPEIFRLYFLDLLDIIIKVSVGDKFIFYLSYSNHYHYDE